MKRCSRAASSPTSSPTRPRRTISSMAMCPSGRSLAEVARACASDDPQTLMQESRATIVRHVRAMLGFKRAGAVVFDNGNLIRTQARDGGVEDAFEFQIFTEAYLRPLFCPRDRAVPLDLAVQRPRRHPQDRRLSARAFPDNRDPRQLDRAWRASTCRSKACRRASPGSGMASAPRSRSRSIAWCATALCRADRIYPRSSRCRRDGASEHHDRAHARRLRRDRRLAVARRHGDVLVAGRSGGDPFRRRRLFRLHDQRRRDCRRRRQPRKPTSACDLSLTNDTSLGVMRYADAGYPEALDEVAKKGRASFPAFLISVTVPSIRRPSYRTTGRATS